MDKNRFLDFTVLPRVESTDDGGASVASGPGSEQYYKTMLQFLTF
jgi:hypothetical protein